ncbi:MAG TPA: hypothetical protein DEP84_35505 [Chloroflexi bacterium]|nr:hypothetical protein [Chloroflexota bacterium]
MLEKRIALFVILTFLVAGLAACSQAPAPAPEPAAQATEAPAQPAAKPTEAPAQAAVQPTEVPVTSEGAGTPKQGGTLTIAQPLEPFTLDSRVDPKVEGIVALAQIMEGLIGKDLKTGKTIPVLAESMEVSPDGTTYTFKLRKGIKFHDGTEFDSEDVLFTFEFLTGARKGSIYAPQYQPNIKSIEAPDKYTFVVTLNTPWEDFESLLINHWATKILSKEAVEKAGDTYGQNGAVGTGPFMFKEWVKGDHVTLVRNPDYWQEGLPNVDSVVYQRVPDGPVRIVNVKSGDADIAFQPPLDQLTQVAQDPALQVICAPGNPQVFITFNTSVPPFDNKAARQAIAYALDRQQLVQSVYGDYAEVAVDMFPAWHWHYDPNYQGWSRDPEKAKELLAEAGYTDSNPLSFELVTLNEAEYRDLGVLIQAQLAEVGINVELRPMESKALVDYRKTDDWKADVGRYILPSTISDDYMWKQFGAKGPLNPMHYNQEGGYQNPKVEEMLNKARTSTREEARSLYRELVDLITEDMPRVRIAYKKNCEVGGLDVRNLQVQGTDVFPVKEVWLDR